MKEKQSLDDCKSCNEGHFSIYGKTEKCQPCPENQYAAAKDSAFCTPCPRYATTNGTTGSTSRDACMCDHTLFRVSLNDECVCDAGYEPNAESKCVKCKGGQRKSVPGDFPCSDSFYATIRLRFAATDWNEEAEGTIEEHLVQLAGVQSAHLQRVRRSEQTIEASFALGIEDEATETLLVQTFSSDDASIEGYSLEYTED